MPRSAFAARARTVSWVVVTLLFGCEASRPGFASVAADSASGIARAGTSGVESHIDPAFVSSGLPTILLNLEAIRQVIPHDEAHRVQLMRTYCQYVSGWLERDLELAVEAGRQEEARALRARTLGLYRYVREMGVSIMRERHSDVETVFEEGPERLRRYLHYRYSGELSAELLFWTASAWARMVPLANEGEIDAPRALAVVRELVRRSAEIAPEYDHGASLALWAATEADLARESGGSAEAARELFERALEVTDRKNAAVLVDYAQHYALMAGDEGLREQLLRSAMAVEGAPDGLRLSNILAGQRAERYLGEGS